MSVPRASDIVLEVGEETVTLERLTAVYAFRQFELETKLVAASRAGRDRDVRALQARQRVLLFETLEWLIDALLVEAAACELGLDGDDARLRRFAEARLGALEHLVAGKPLARCCGGPAAAVEEVRLSLCLPPPELLQIVRWLCLREQAEHALGRASRRRDWLAARRERSRVVRRLDSHAYAWMVDHLLPVREAWWQGARDAAPHCEAA